MEGRGPRIGIFERETERESHWRIRYADVINSGMSVGKFLQWADQEEIAEPLAQARRAAPSRPGR